MRSAMVNNSTNTVENIIVADPMSDPAPEGYTLAALSDDSPVAIGWIWQEGAFEPPETPSE